MVVNEDRLAMARGNFGYGRWDAPYWFVGPEQGMEPGLKNATAKQEENLLRRISVWNDLGRLDLNDCREFHRRLSECRWHFKEPLHLQVTWRPLMLLLMVFKGNDEPDKTTLKNYQRDRWGTSNKEYGETCVIELSGLSSPSLNESQETGLYLQERIQEISNKIQKHRPKLVVMYGKKQALSWEKVAGKPFPKQLFSYLSDGQTLLVSTPHPSRPIKVGSRYLVDEYWKGLGQSLRKLHQSIPA